MQAKKWLGLVDGVRTVPGWKSDIEKQIFLSGWKRPEGVSICKYLRDRGSVRIDENGTAENAYLTHLDTWGLKWVLGREEEYSVVLSACEG